MGRNDAAGTSPVIQRLLGGDVAIQYQVHRDLLDTDTALLQQLQIRIAREGWGKRLLACRQENGHWGRGFYQPKWTSTHYTLLDLKNLGIAPATGPIKQAITLILEKERGVDGGINPSRTIAASDVCINGMFLNYAAYFKSGENELEPVIDFLLSQRLGDGGFNCFSNRSGARHSSLHTTLSVCEGIREYALNGYRYRLPELQAAEAAAQDFILRHRLYLSDRTGSIIDKKFLNLVYPPRWRYDILRALDYFRLADTPYDERMAPALEALIKKRTNSGFWKAYAPHPGQTHFEMEKTGEFSYWNTLRALRVLQQYPLA